jgi:hypothetical protein
MQPTNRKSEQASVVQTNVHTFKFILYRSPSTTPQRAIAMEEEKTQQEVTGCEGPGCHSSSCDNEKCGHDDNESSVGGSDDEQLTIGFDQHGRIMPPVGGPVNYNFQCFKNCVARDSPDSHERLVAECNTVFTARETDDGETYSSGETYFIGADATPRTSLERLALDIFKHHSNGLTFDAAKSGAEWWTLCLESDAGVGAHWDKDYGIESDHGVNVFPHISTVTYLSEIGAPTVIAEMRAPTMASEEISGVAGEKLLVSFPKVGKHISFDGRFLHFASEALVDDDDESDEDREQSDAKVARIGEGDNGSGEPQRVSFLVNVWFNHVPIESCALPDALVDLCNKLPGSAAKSHSGGAKAGVSSPSNPESDWPYQHWNADGVVAASPVEWKCPASGSSSGASASTSINEGSVIPENARAVQEEVGETHVLSFCAPLEAMPSDQDISVFIYADEAVRPRLIRVMNDPECDEEED